MRRVPALLFVATLGLASLPAALPASAAPSSTVAISGIFKDNGAPIPSAKLILLTKGGQGLVTTTGVDGSFSITVKRSRLANASLQIVDGTDRYVGPVTLATDTGTAFKLSATQGAAHMRFASTATASTIKLGTLAAKHAADGHVMGAVASKARCTPGQAAACWYLRTPAVFFNPKTDQGLPPAAARYGLKRKPVQFTVAQAGKLSGHALPSAPRQAMAAGMDANTEPGSDQDSDGVPNVLDVDDNGNASMDSVDAASKRSASANLNPVTSVHLDYGSGRYEGFGQAGMSGAETYNAETNSSLTAADASQLIGTMSGTSVAYEQGALLGALGLPANGEVNWARVECGSIQYCGAGSPTARFVQMGYAQQNNGDTSLCPGNGPSCFASLYPAANSGGLSWSDFGGYRWQPSANDGSGSTNGMTGTCPAVTRTNNDGVLPQAWLDANAGVPANALSLLCRNNGDLMQIWYAGFYNNAPTGAGVDTFLPGDVYELQVHVAGDGTLDVRTLPITLSPYYATVPGIEKVNGSALDTTSSTAALGLNGKLSVDFFRPQRLELPGESGTRGFMDQAGLHYGVLLSFANSYQPLFCGGYYSDLSANLTNAMPTGTVNVSSGYTGSYPLADATIVDDAPDGSVSTHRYSFTIDVKGCVDHGSSLLNEQGQRVWPFVPTWAELSGKRIHVGLGAMGAEMATYQMNQAVTGFYVSVPGS